MSTEIITVDRETWGRIQEAVKYFEKRILGDPFTRSNPALSSDEIVAVYNTSPGEAPQYGVLRFDLAALHDDGEHQARRTAWPGISRIGIATDPMASMSEGSVWVAGVHPVLCQNIDNLMLGHRLGSKRGSFYAQEDECGALLVLAKLADRGEETAPAGYAVCLITGRRGDHVYVQGDSGPAVRLASQVWMFGTGFTVTEEQPGVVRIDPVGPPGTTTAAPPTTTA